MHLSTHGQRDLQATTPSGARGVLGSVLALVAVLFGLLFATHAGAQTSVSGPITASTRWTVQGGPYLVGTGVVIDNGAVLTIDPGVTVYVAPDAGLTLHAGSIVARGTAAQPIQVLSDRKRTATAAAGDWGQWVFNAGTVNTVLEHVVFENGRGLVINGSSPVLNYLEVRGQLGAAITIDLAASPTGVGNRASGNTINGIAVPAGDINGNVRWGLRGIPYVVASGTVSVGASPTVTSVSPTTIERGQTLTLTVTGTRLGGLSSVALGDGLTITPFSGGSATQQSLQVRASDSAPLGAMALRLQVDAGEFIVPAALTVTPTLPAITAIAPATVTAGAGPTEVVVTGRNFTAQSQVLVNAAAVTTQYVSATEVRGTLPNQTAAATLPVQVRTPNESIAGQYLTSNAVNLSVQLPVPPTVAFEPTPIAMPPDSRAREVTIRLSKADFRDHTINLSVSDATKATVAPASVTIAAGQTAVKISITPLTTGTVTVLAQSPTLGNTSVPLFVTADFSGVNTSYAPPVGVVVEGTPTTSSVPITVTHNTVGVSVGAVLTGASPRGWAAGSAQTFTIAGTAIPPAAQVTMVPATGITLGAVTVAADGTTLSFTATAASDAAAGPRRLVVRDSAGALLTFADPSRSTVTLTTGAPSIESVEPLQAIAGSTVSLVVRGRHLQGARLQLLPADGIEVDVQPQVNVEGTQLTATLRIAAGAPLGAKTIQVVTASGASSAEPRADNVLQVVSAIRQTYTPIASNLVGVVVGNAAPPSDPKVATPFTTANVGVIIGATVTEVSPRTGVVGTDTTVVVRGQGLQDVISAALSPDTGLTIGSPSVNAQGTELTFNLRVDAAATLGLRRLALRTATGSLIFARAGDAAFLVTAQIPELSATAPQVLRIGAAAQTISLRGRNFVNVTGVRLQPSQGVVVSGPITASSDGTSLTFTLLAEAAATPGARVIVVTAAAGESSTTAAPGNSITLASQVGPTYADITSSPVGVTVGSAAPQGTAYDGSLIAPAVGVMVGATVTETVGTNAIAPQIGVVVGTAANDMSPKGWLQGATGTVTVSGVGLSQVTSAQIVPADGLLLSDLAVNGGGTQLTLSLSVSPSAAQVPRRLKLVSAAGDVTWLEPARSLFAIGSLPNLSSVSPIVLERGQMVTLTVRGSNLRGVTAVSLLPGDGVVAAAPVWSQDGLGELLTVNVFIDASAATGNRVLRLEVPGGGTSTVPSVANTVQVVAR
jgi:hypothetical protein